MTSPLGGQAGCSEILKLTFKYLWQKLPNSNIRVYDILLCNKCQFSSDK